MNIELDFKDMVAVCSGGASGMGLLCGRKFAASGGKVVLCDINEDAVKKRAAEICEKGGTAIGLKVDVTDYFSIQKAVDAIMAKFGRIDCLVNTAGGASTRLRGCRDNFWERDPEILSWGLDLNLKGSIFFIRAVFKHMLENRHGCIINLGSVYGEEGGDCIDYAAAKSGMHGLTKSVARAGAPYGVRCCCVVPGPVLTRPGMANMKTALGRAARPDELCDFILYLCDDTHGGFITGTSHIVDGGRLLATF